MTAFEIMETDANDRLTQDDSLHNIFAIKGRVQRLVTEKIAYGLTRDELFKKLGLNEKEFNSYMDTYERLNKFEQAIKKIS